MASAKHSPPSSQNSFWLIFKSFNVILSSNISFIWIASFSPSPLPELMKLGQQRGNQVNKGAIRSQV